MERQELLQTLVDHARRMLSEGLVRGTSGNISCRLADGQVAITPTAMDYTTMQVEDVALVDMTRGAWLHGRAPSSELPLHLSVYQARPDVMAVVHTHSTFATVLAVTSRALPAVHYLLAPVGNSVPVAPYATYGTPELGDAVVRTLGGGGAVLMQNHGVVTVGVTIEEAYSRAKTVETVAELYVRALAVGDPIEIPAAEMANLRKRMRSYGPTGRLR